LVAGLIKEPEIQFSKGTVLLNLTFNRWNNIWNGAAAFAVMLTALICLLNHPGTWMAWIVMGLLVLSTIWNFVNFQEILAFLPPLAVLFMDVMADHTGSNAGAVISWTGLLLVLCMLCFLFMDYVPSGKEWVNGKRRGRYTPSHMSQRGNRFVLTDRDGEYDLERIFGPHYQN
jgi:hypothetical protein